MTRKIAVCFGGISPEHEVSVITGLQVIENIDQESFEPFAIYFSKSGVIKLQNIHTRKDFKIDEGKPVFFARDDRGTYFSESRPLAKKIYLDAVYLAFHGGAGESGAAQGFFETLCLPVSSSGVEGSAVSMNKAIANKILKASGVNVVDGVSITSDEIARNIDTQIDNVVSEISLPVIVKPVHLGSSIGISVAKTKIELKKGLLLGSQIDSEVLVEKFLSDFVEYNCAVRKVNGQVECSEIERPIKQEEILSFKDKYQSGGNKKASGMASLIRELPAKIDDSLKEKIQDIAKHAFVVARLKGMARIDFMVTSNRKIYLTEINPIPGSMAYYLWEAAGVSFTQQITDLINQSITDYAEKLSKNLDYKTDIVQEFVSR